MIAFLLVIVGALNWGLVGIFSFNLVNFLVGGWPLIERIVYILVGLSAISEIIMHPAVCACCAKKATMMK